MEQLQENLQILEVPADLTAIDFDQHNNTVYGFRDFAKLKELGITQKAL